LDKGVKKVIAARFETPEKGVAKNKKAPENIAQGPLEIRC